MEHTILSWMIFIPLIGAALILLLPSGAHGLIRTVAVAATIPPLWMAVWLLRHFDPSAPGFQFVQHFAWIPSFDVNYFVGIDGISVTMIVLTALLCFLCMIASFGIEKGVKGYFALFLLLDTGMMGVFSALDFFLFFVFWEVMLLPMYFLIGVWGGPRREYAAIKFFLYTLFGSVLMLLAMIALYFSVAVTDPATGEKIHTFSMLAMMNPANYAPGSLLAGVNTGWRYLAYIALFIGFAIKVPIFPFH